MPYAARGALLLVLVLCVGCTAWQPTKEVWKTTKGLWYTYVSPPATVDYDDKGSSPPEAVSLSHALMSVDMELGKLERVMQNADRPPTQEWLSNLFGSFPWLSGFAGVKYDGQILGQEPPDSLKQLDFIPLLYEDKKQNTRALRAEVQRSPLGPEIMLATPLYDGTDFLGIVVAYFDMRSLMRLSENARDIVVLCPQSLLWPGKYDFAATPLAGVDWDKVVRESSSGTCSNSTGSFYYMVRYLGNLPLVFAVPSSGTFPEGNCDIADAQKYFLPEPEKLPPPPVPERKNARTDLSPAFVKPEPEPEPEPEPTPPPMPAPSERGVIRQGSRDSVLLRKQREAARRRQLQERALAGENVEWKPEPPEENKPRLRLLPEEQGPSEALPGGRPSPFGPRGGAPAATAEDVGANAPPETQPAAPAEDVGANAPAEQAPAAPEKVGDVGKAAAPAAPAVPPEISSLPDQDVEPMADGEAPGGGEERQPPQLPGGRPSPFGPR